jgi:dihydroflavonol-4-reductase
MARHRMYFSSARAVRDLGYRWRPAQQAIDDAVRWFLQARG